MAGETTKTTNLTNRREGLLRRNRGVSGILRTGQDTHSFAAVTELETADAKIFEIPIPSNAIILDVASFHDDMETDGTPTLVVDIGLAAGAAYTSVTSGVATHHARDDIIDADLLVDGATGFQAAVTAFTSLTPDSDTWGAEDRLKEVWQLLGYDEDPHTTFNIVLVSATAATGLSAAADCTLKVEYLVD